PSKAFSQQKEQFEKLNLDSKRKSQVIKVLNQMSIEIANILTLETLDDFEKDRRLVYNYLLATISGVLKKDASNTTRVAIFVEDKQGNLKIQEGIGFSSEGQKHLRLDIHDSVAGHTYKSGEPYISG